MPDHPKRPRTRSGAAAAQEPAPPVRWEIYIARAKGALLGTVEAPTAGAAIDAAAKQFERDPKRLIAVRRG